MEREVYSANLNTVISSKGGQHDYTTFNICKKPAAKPEGYPSIDDDDKGWVSCFSITLRDCKDLDEAVEAIRSEGLLEEVNNKEWRDIAEYFNSLDYDIIVATFIKLKYPSDKMQAIHNNFMETLVPDEEFKAMQEWRILAKSKAKDILEI